MFKYIMCLFVVLVPSFVSAQESKGDESLTPEQQSERFCNIRYSGAGSADALKRLFCIQNQNLRILDSRMQKGEEGLTNQVEELRKQLEETKAELAKQAQAHPTPSPNPPVGPASDPAPAPQPQGPSLPAFVGGVPFEVIDAPGQLAATTRDVEGIDRLWVQSILDGVKYFRRGATQVRVVVRKNGITVPVAQPDFSTPFDEFYADVNNDGNPDPRVYKGIDPSRIDDVYISNVGPRDVVELVYLVPTGRFVTVAGLPPQILWGRPVRTKLDRLSDIGRWKMSATTAVALR